MKTFIDQLAKVIVLIFQQENFRSGTELMPNFSHAATWIVIEISPNNLRVTCDRGAQARDRKSIGVDARSNIHLASVYTGKSGCSDFNVVAIYPYRISHTTDLDPLAFFHWRCAVVTKV